MRQGGGRALVAGRQVFGPVGVGVVRVAVGGDVFLPGNALIALRSLEVEIVAGVEVVETGHALGVMTGGGAQGRAWHERAEAMIGTVRVD